MNLGLKDWTGFVYSVLVILVMMGTVGVWAGDQRWVVAEVLTTKVRQLEINQLDREITFLLIKIQQGEASSSEMIYIKTLEQQLRALKVE